eukprot:CAMPEP_0113416320 /NCGR_PEP_ID=MMETSP0013_2-20120614/25055_1 /TAXON_ID=2843 ORGANISM="Skeletonema costatum, Strain 1716" /NCGR_SAMPLE_ID=MMETSP0013_2 /ASSEMBLY_ACC=CAM_ASM_000158 /LENGTH=1289 /DNA_ID=CAMNT_0000303371 /DNA_START=63 /DNA_END=3933 /DNA_ORIENTATION=- /assembly_acc=CAM_ASM_000158
MEEFHTPESSGYPDQMRTPGTVSATQRSSLPASAGGTTPMTATSGKKRPASSDNDDDSDDSMDNNTSFFGRIVSSVTPWRRKNKRSRSSLDSMSGSAIKSASRLPASEDSDRSNNSNGGGGSSGKKTLGKLNLEHKFHETPAATAAATGAVAAMPVQTLNGQQTANNFNEGNGPAKRVRLAEGTVTAAATTNGGNNNGGDGGAIKAVRIGGTTFVSSNTTTTATAKSNTSQSVTFQDATMPKFNIGSTTKLKDVRGRTATPARASRSSKWGTPSAGARYGSKNTLPQDGLMTTGPSGIAATTTTNKGGYQRRSINSLSTTSSRGGAYRRRAINARGFKPMSSLLSRIHSDNTTNGGGRNNGIAATGQSKQQSLFLSNSIADQILRDAQNKLFQSTASGGGGGNYQEGALFGVAPSDNNNNNNNGARTFEEEAAQYKAVTNKGSAVPRVRMNRVFGSGQLGGRAQQLESAPSTATTTAKSFGTGGGTTAATAGFGTTASISLQPSIASKSMMPAATSFSAPSTSTQIAAAAPKAVAFSAFKIDPIPARGEGKTQLTPCRADDNLSQQLGDEISQLVSTDAFKRKAVQNNPFEDVSEATKTPKKKSKGTPHPKKAGGSNVKPVSEAAGGTPFNFMPGGAAASSKVDVPLAFNYGKKSDVPQSSSPAISKSPAKAVAPVATDTSETTTTASTEGWGNIFANQKKQWKCNACTSQNPLDETSCLSCEAPRDGTASKSDAAPGSGKSGSDKNASIGTGGFKFGAPASTAAPAPAASSAGTIGAGGFSFGGASSSSASAATPAIKFGVTPSKKEEQKDDTKTSAGSGFSFGSATPAKAKPSSGGFSFGGTSTTPSSTTESNVDANDDKKDVTSKGSIGFSFGASTSTSSSSKTNATFSFGQSSASSGADENKGDTANTGAFKFGATSSEPKPKRGRGGDEENDKKDGGKKKASIGAGFSFGSSATENKATPSTSFAFGAASKKDDVPSAQATTFAFGSTASEKKTDNAATSFAFGSTPAASEKKTTTASAGTSGFSFGQSTASSGAASSIAEKKEPSFSFGQAASATPAPEKKDNSAPTPAPAFAFGAAAPSAAPKAPAPAAAFQFGSQAPAAAPPASASLFGGSGFGMTQPAAPQPVAAPAPAFGFGAAAQTPAPVAPAPAFGFGGSAQPVAAPNPGFAFGSNPTAAATPAPAFGMPPAAPPAATPAFGVSSAATPAPAGFGGGGFGGTQAPAHAMNGGAPSGGFNIGTGGGAKKTLEGELLEQGDHRAVDVEQARYSCHRTELSGDKMKDSNN